MHGPSIHRLPHSGRTVHQPTSTPTLRCAWRGLGLPRIRAIPIRTSTFTARGSTRSIWTISVLCTQAVTAPRRKLNWTIGNQTLTSISGYEEYHFNATNDDGTPFDIYRTRVDS